MKICSLEPHECGLLIGVMMVVDFKIYYSSAYLTFGATLIALVVVFMKYINLLTIVS